jgi:hypothetical protein
VHLYPPPPKSPELSSCMVYPIAHRAPSQRSIQMPIEPPCRRSIQMPTEPLAGGPRRPE